MTITAPGFERRQHERRYLRTVATVVLGPVQTFEVRTVDISAGGMAVVAAANPQPGTTFTIRVPLSFPHEGVVVVETRAQVMHSVLASDEQGFKIGLRFVSLEAAAASTILRYLK